MWYIVEYKKGGYERNIVTDSLEHPRKFKTKKQAERFLKDLFEADDSYLYKIWNTNGCADGDCNICLNEECPNYEDYVTN